MFIDASITLHVMIRAGRFKLYHTIARHCCTATVATRNTGTGSDGRSCHLRHCPHKLTQNNKIQMKHHSENSTKNMHSKDSYSAVNSPRINTFFWETLPLPKVHSKLCLETLLPNRQLCKALTTWDDTVSLGQPISITQSQQSNKQINNWKMRHMSNQLQVYIKPRLDVIIQT